MSKINKSSNKEIIQEECPNILSAFICSSKNPYCIAENLKKSLSTKCKLKREQLQFNSKN